MIIPLVRRCCHTTPQLWFEIVHRAEDYPECVIAKPYGESLTGTGYPSKEVAIAKWNKRAKIYDEK